MKNYILLTLMLLLSLGTQAFSDPVTKTSNCRLDSTSRNFTANDRDRIVVDLVNRNWIISEVTTDQSFAQAFNFDEIGTVTVTTTFDGKAEEEVKTMIWQLSVENNQAILTLTNIDTDTFTSYAVNETCEGLTLTNLLLNKQLALIVQ